MHSLHRHNKVTVLLKLVPYEREFSGGAEEKETERRRREEGEGREDNWFCIPDTSGESRARRRTNEKVCASGVRLESGDGRLDIRGWSDFCFVYPRPLLFKKKVDGLRRCHHRLCHLSWRVSKLVCFKSDIFFIPISSYYSYWLHFRFPSSMCTCTYRCISIHQNWTSTDSGLHPSRIRAGSHSQKQATRQQFFLARDRLNGNKYSVHSALDSSQEPRPSIITKYDPPIT